MNVVWSFRAQTAFLTLVSPGARPPLHSMNNRSLCWCLCAYTYRAEYVSIPSLMGFLSLVFLAGCHRVVVKNENAALTKMQPSVLIYVLPLKTESLKVRGRTWFGWSTPAPQPSHSSLLPARGGDRDHCCLHSPWSSWQLPGHCLSQPGSGTVPRVPAACEHTTTGLRGLLCVLVPAGRQDAGSVGTSPCPALPCTRLPVGFVPAPALAPKPLCFTGRCRAA